MIDPKLKQGRKWLEARQDRQYPISQRQDKYTLPILAKPARLMTKCECGAENPLRAETCVRCGRVARFAVKNRPGTPTPD